VRIDVPALVQAFELQQQQQQQQQPQQPQQPQPQQQPGANSSEGEPQILAAVAPVPLGDNSMRDQMAALEQLVRTQAQQMRDQAQQLQQLHSSPLLVPQAALQQSRFARKEPRAQDLREYDGASGAKLEEWLQELAKVVRLFSLNGREAVEFGTARLTGAALQWSLALDAQQQAVLTDSSTLAAGLRARFQPVGMAVLAREQLDRLVQGPRSVNDYIADFQRLRAQLPDMGEADALHALGRGLHADLLQKLREHNVSTVQAAIELAARIGGLRQAAVRATVMAAAQMEIDDGDGASLDDRIQRAVINAMHSQQSSSSGASSSGLGAKTQTLQSYGSGRGRGGPTMPQRGGGSNRFAQRPPPNIPGVSPELFEQRRAAGVCYRCGGDHRSIECPNVPSSRPTN